jgi:hypothetical protein
VSCLLELFQKYFLANEQCFPSVEVTDGKRETCGKCGDVLMDTDRRTTNQGSEWWNHGQWRRTKHERGRRDPLLLRWQGSPS